MAGKLKDIYNFLNPKKQNLYLEYKTDFKPRYGHGKPPHRLLNEIINKERAVYSEYLNKTLSYKEQFFKIKTSDKKENDIAPCWNNGFLPGLDIVNLYMMIAEAKPNKYIEVGSGNSTKVAFKAKQENNLATKIISIDPMPRAEIDQLADEVIRQPFEDYFDHQFLASLEANDILFIDNSHRVLPNSDAMVFFMDVLPYLKKGVIVHIHDIYLPYDYPQFMCDRFYSEQYSLAPFILANPDKYLPILPNYFISEDPDLKKILDPIWKHERLKDVEQHGGSFWLKINQ